MLQAMWSVTIELAPWLILGAVVAGAMHALAPRGLLARWLGGHGGVWRSVVVGVPLPLCSCAVIPVGLGLKRQGASDGASVAFLIATPQTGVDSVLVTAGMLGWPLALFKLATAMVTGLVGGWLTNAVTPRGFSLPIVDPPSGAQGRTSLLARVWGGAVHADDLIHSVWKWLVMGVVVSAAISVYTPAGWLEGLAAYGGALAMGAALAFSLPLYVCATASVPIAASLVAGGMPLGAVIVFLMAGPATNAATVGAVYRTLGWRALWVYLGVIVVGSVASGVAFDLLFSDAGFPGGGRRLAHEHGGAVVWWQASAAGLLVVWLAWCAGRDLVGRFSSAPSGHDHGVAQIDPD